ncbi:DUF2069 domain-containing protein [Coralloluteibacterium thermophilus]|uniref:DUF2069 domain-containing protein n=1 Tax=Coralloluteibacterium thermophilum TaxID=2707049 RepID=A0ABV9NLF0_9GAMM
MNAHRLALLGIIALTVLQPVWHVWLMPPRQADPGMTALLFSLPLLPVLVLGMLRRPSTTFWGSVVALLYFVHGVTEAWGSDGVNPLALIEIALACGIVLAASWTGMRARFARRRGRTP